MTAHGRIPELVMCKFIRFTFAGPLRRTVPAISQTAAQAKAEAALAWEDDEAG